MFKKQFFNIVLKWVLKCLKTEIKNKDKLVDKKWYK